MKHNIKEKLKQSNCFYDPLKKIYQVQETKEKELIENNGKEENIKIIREILGSLKSYLKKKPKVSDEDKPNRFNINLSLKSRIPK